MESLVGLFEFIIVTLSIAFALASIVGIFTMLMLRLDVLIMAGGVMVLIFALICIVQWAGSAITGTDVMQHFIDTAPEWTYD